MYRYRGFQYKINEVGTLGTQDIAYYIDKDNHSRRKFEGQTPPETDYNYHRHGKQSQEKFVIQTGQTAYNSGHDVKRRENMNYPLYVQLSHCGI